MAKGQSLVELAISFVILMMLLVGATEFGLAFTQVIQLRDAAQEGALYGSLHPFWEDKIELRARNASNSPLDLMNSDVKVVTSISDEVPGCVGDAITVQVSYDHRLFTPLSSWIVGSDVIPLRAQVIDTILDCRDAP